MTRPKLWRRAVRIFFAGFLCASCGSSTKATGSPGTDGAAGQLGSTGGDAGTMEQGGAGRGMGGTTGKGGADGGSGATGSGGAGGGTAGSGGAGGSAPPACAQHGGTCPGDCVSVCQAGTTEVTLVCPIVTANAVCGGMHCCLPTTSYSCGADTCTTGQSFCYSFSGGVPGAGTSRSCQTLPAACAKNPTCACVCPPTGSGSPTFGCTFAGGFGSMCSCSEGSGQVTVSCFGA